MTRVQKEWKDFVVSEVKKKWNDVFFDSCCVYDDGAMALCFGVSTGCGMVTLVSAVIEKGETGRDIMERLNERIAWTFASAHFTNNVQ